MKFSLRAKDHRPWPVPSGPGVMAQRWHELLFAHWAVPVEALRPLVPAGAEADTHEGQAGRGLEEEPPSADVCDRERNAHGKQHE
jgi:uncharacterized protein